jgi:mannose-6-phosphate isomerase
MPELYPFLLRPQFVERVWGARDLAPVYDHKLSPQHQPIGEVWLTGDECQIASGPLAGKTLGQAAQQFGRKLTGEASPIGERFPLLIKFLFPREKLSVQVHPDDAAARRLGQPCGKNECWYVLAAEKGSQVALGLKPGATREQFRHAIEQTRAEELLNWIDIHAGEMIYADAGTVHAIGPGSILVETQQNSDTTFRLYDYGRPRELHVEQGLAVMKENTNAGKVQRPADHPESKDGNQNLVTSPCFVVNGRRLQAGKEHLITRHMPPSSVQILVGLAGAGSVAVKGCEPVSFSAGEAAVVPAEVAQFSVRPQQNFEYLHVSLPQDEVAHPQTTLA